MPDADTEAAIFMITHQTCEALGYEGYEVSNFARTEGPSLAAQQRLLGASRLSRFRPLGPQLPEPGALLEHDVPH